MESALYHSYLRLYAIHCVCCFFRMDLWIQRSHIWCTYWREGYYNLCTYWMSLIMVRALSYVESHYNLCTYWRSLIIVRALLYVESHCKLYTCSLKVTTGRSLQLEHEHRWGWFTPVRTLWLIVFLLSTLLVAYVFCLRNIYLLCLITAYICHYWFF